jgi:hypothetical protein
MAQGLRYDSGKRQALLVKRRKTRLSISQSDRHSVACYRLLPILRFLLPLHAPRRATSISCYQYSLDMTDQLLTISELRKQTQESESAWRKRLLRGELPYLKLGANVRVRLEDFEAWLEARTVTPEREQ